MTLVMPRISGDDRISWPISVLSFTVSSRAQEIGVRLALGAQRTDILGMILADAARLSAAGILFGAATAWLAGSSMRALLAGVDPADVPTFAAAIALCALMALTEFPSPTAEPPDMVSPAMDHLLTYGSTRRLTEEELARAVHIDPATAIRVE